jgi:hypothetical protein
MLKDFYTIKQLADIMRISKLSLWRNFDKYFFPIDFMANKRTLISAKDIEKRCPDMYASILLTLDNISSKPIFTVSDIKKYLQLSSRNGTIVWIKRHNIPFTKIGNKIILFANRLYAMKE